MDEYRNLLKFMFCFIIVGVIILNGIGNVALAAKNNTYQEVTNTKTFSLFQAKAYKGKKTFTYFLEVYE